MPSVRYVGPHDAVDLLLPSGAEVTVRHGELLETTGEHAAGLLEQPTNWTSLVDPEAATVASLKADLEARGIEIPQGAKKADLVALLEEANAPPAGDDNGGDSPPDPADTGHAN